MLHSNFRKSVDVLSEIKIHTRKMFYIVLMIFCSCVNVDGINLTYIVKKDESVIHPSCIAEELQRYDAIGWIYPIQDFKKLPVISAKFLPTIEDDYNCEFSNNHICTTRWALKDWRIDDSLPKTREALFDYRWEDLPTILISNKSKEFEKNFELGNIPKASFSIRAEGMVELLFCSGWNPYNYPCYYFNINYRTIHFKMYTTIPKNRSEEYKKSSLQIYRAYSDILSHSEWRNFVVEFHPNGTVKLTDSNLNRTLIEQSLKEVVTPLYMFMISANVSLWKFHENRFLHTTTTQISRLGPQLNVPGKDLCISLLISMCEICEMSFFYLNENKKTFLKSVTPVKEEEWFEIKLKEENIQLDKFNIFVETKLKTASGNKSGFWAIDNVRICNENEVKVTYLKMEVPIQSETDVTCQLIKKHNWRPKPHIYNKIQDFPQVNSVSGTDSIKLSWAQEDPLNEISYFISYKANDLCTSEPFNEKRIKSTGFMSTKLNQAILDNLIPFTLYNITLNSVLHENEKEMLIHTLETDELQPEELPYGVKVTALDTTVNISWEPVPCHNIYGRIVYTLIVSNKDLNFTKRLNLETNTKYEIGGLEPFTKYSLTIISARNGRNIYQNKYTYPFTFNFTTSSGVAPPVQNLELYSIDKNSASLRFDLPVTPRGIAREVQVNKCNALSFRKCKSNIFLLRECPFWPKKFCIDLEYLISNQTYDFKVSLKNVNTHTFGKETSVKGFTTERVPGPPTNITYRIDGCYETTDSCHLNISWLHPYNQNGTITSFNIILNSTDTNEDLENSKYIQELYKIENKTYYSFYTYQIKYLPYSRTYDLYIQSENLVYKSEFSHISLKTDNIGDHIDQSPKLLLKSESSLIFQLPILDKRLDHYVVTVLVQDYNTSVKVDPEILKNRKVADNLCLKYGNSWISQTHKVDLNKIINVTIGKTEKDKLVPDGKYCVSFIITNNYKGAEHDVVYYEKLKMKAASPGIPESTVESGFNPLYLLLILLLLIPIAFIGYRIMKRNKRKSTRSAENNENVYESLPFDECESNCVVNENYDKLIHK